MQKICIDPCRVHRWRWSLSLLFSFFAHLYHSLAFLAWSLRPSPTLHIRFVLRYGKNLTWIVIYSVRENPSLSTLITDIHTVLSWHEVPESRVNTRRRRIRLRRWSSSAQAGWLIWWRNPDALVNLSYYKILIKYYKILILIWLMLMWK